MLHTVMTATAFSGHLMDPDFTINSRIAKNHIAVVQSQINTVLRLEVWAIEKTFIVHQFKAQIDKFKSKLRKIK